MQPAKRRFLSAILVSLGLLMTPFVIGSPNVDRPSKRPFTVSDDIQVAYFEDFVNAEGLNAGLKVSPDGATVVAAVERGSVKDNLVQAEVRVYDMSALRQFARASGPGTPPNPVWQFVVTAKQGPVVTDIRWLSGTRAFVFLEHAKATSPKLMYADIEKRTIEQLSLDGQAVSAFDVVDRSHYVYSVRSEELKAIAQREDTSTSIAWTGRDFVTLFDRQEMLRWATRSDLWSANASKPAPVVDSDTGRAIVLYPGSSSALSLSKDGRFAVAILALQDVPASWEREYPPPYPNDPFRVRAGRQDLNAAMDADYVGEYTKIDLASGRVAPITGGPATTRATGWWNAKSHRAMWSNNGERVILPGVFVSHAPVPCVAVANFKGKTVECLEQLTRATSEGTHERGYRYIIDGKFENGRDDQVRVKYIELPNVTEREELFERSAGSSWVRARSTEKVRLLKDFTLTVDQSLNGRPVLTVADHATKHSKNVWDPNPQLDGIALGDVSVFKWTTPEGREWTGGLYLPPPDSHSSAPYPLVIQTHGFRDDIFRPYGSFTSGFAAQELAAAGIAVLQADECDLDGRDEGPCQVEGFDSAVKQLADRGLVDPNRVGLVGFSHTCFHIMEAIAFGKEHYAAALVTDGVNLGYFETLLMPDSQDSNWEAESIGAQPYGAGLRAWMDRSPEFNFDKVRTPLSIIGLGRLSVMTMWEPYALLRKMNKPVDLILLRGDEYEHVLTNPAVRMSSQGGAVDWFRFWLQGYERREPAYGAHETVESLVAQYSRWEQLCDLQVAQNPPQGSLCVRSRARPADPNSDRTSGSGP